jgi:hypothetical protein
VARRKTNAELIKELHKIEDEITALINEWVWFRSEIKTLKDPLKIGQYLRSADRLQEKIRKKSLKQKKILGRLKDI